MAVGPRAADGLRGWAEGLRLALRYTSAAPTAQFPLHSSALRRKLGGLGFGAGLAARSRICNVTTAARIADGSAESRETIVREGGTAAAAAAANARECASDRQRELVAMPLLLLLDELLKDPDDLRGRRTRHCHACAGLFGTRMKPSGYRGDRGTQAVFQGTHGALRSVTESSTHST